MTICIESFLQLYMYCILL